MRFLFLSTCHNLCQVLLVFCPSAKRFFFPVFDSPLNSEPIAQGHPLHMPVGDFCILGVKNHAVDLLSGTLLTMFVLSCICILNGTIGLPSVHFFVEMASALCFPPK